MPLLVLETLAANAAAAVAALALGEPVLALAARAVGARSEPERSLRRLGATLLVGFGSWSLVGVVLGLLHVFFAELIAVVAALVVVLGRRALAGWGRWAWAAAIRLRRGDRVALALCGGALVVLVGRWLGALAPPEAYDELAYHLPEAQSIVALHALPLTVWQDAIYGNLPLGMEVLYAEGLAVQGTELVHAIQLTVLVAFVVFAAGVLREVWGPRTAALAVLLLALYDELLYNATTGYVDVGAVAFELGGVLALARWLSGGDRRDAALGWLLLGFALGIKYTALATAGLAVAATAIVLYRDRRLRLALPLLGLAVAAGGFWYAKNLVRFGNPVYPLYLGHRGIPEPTYHYFVGRVQQFGPRTLKAFVETPWKYATDADAAAFVAFYVAPFAAFVRRGSRVARLLLLYAIIYATYWFWIASHQTRFLMPAVVVAILLSAVAVVHARAWAMRVAVVLVAAAAVGVAQAQTHGFSLEAAPAAVGGLIGGPKAEVALGLESRGSYLRRHFGCEYDAVAWLRRRGAVGDVLIPEGHAPLYFATRNPFRSFAATATTISEARRDLRRAGFRFAFVRTSDPGNLSSNIPTRAVLAHDERLLWREGDCALYGL